MKKKYDVNLLYKLKDEGYLRVEKHSKYELYLWKYTNHCQYEQYWTEETLACRSLVLDENGFVVSPCLSKFFNIEENKHIPTEEFIITEKLDGQLVYVFLYDDKLIIRSSGSFISSVVKNVETYFGDKLRQVIVEGFTFGFELTGKCAKIVIDYPQLANLTQIVTFRNSTLEEVDIPLHHFSRPQRVYFRSIYDIKECNTEDEEGYVVKFSNGSRCKIKFQNYIDKHYFRFALSNVLVWEHLMNNTLESYLQEVPDESYPLITKCAFEILKEVENVRKQIQFNLNIINSIQFENRRELFEFVNNMTFSSLTLAQYDRKDITESIYKLIKPEFKLLV